MYGLTAFVASPLSSYVTAARGEWSVGTALSLTTATYSTGMAIGPVSGGWIAEHFGMRAAYLAAAWIFVASTLFMLFIQGQPVDRHDPEAPPLDLRRNPGFVRFLAVVAFAVFAMYLAQPLTPNFLAGVRNLPLDQTGWIFSAGALGNAVLAVSLSRVRPRRGFLLAQSLVILFAVCIWRGAGLPVFMLGYFLLGGFRAARPMYMAQVRGLVHESQMGLAYGTMETVGSAIFVLAPPLAGFLFEIDPYLLYPLSIGLLAASIVVGHLFAPGKESHA
jgi:MFS family permease